MWRGSRSVAVVFLLGSVLGSVLGCVVPSSDDDGGVESGPSALDEDVVAISTEGPIDPGAEPRNEAPAPVIAPVLANLAREVKTRSPSTVLGVAVYDYATQEYAGADDNGLHVSASSAKAIWVAAALKRSTIAKVTPHAKPIFESSSNDAAGAVIDIAGPNYLNDFYASAGMTRSGYLRWMGARVATNCPGLVPENNYFTAKDSVAFLNGVFRGTLLDAPRTAKLKEWMTWSPDSGYGGWIGTLLPASARVGMMHKAGWLPPPYDARATNEIGIIRVADDHWYAIAILARRGSNWDAQAKFVEHASCAVYKAIAKTPALDCK